MLKKSDLPKLTLSNLSAINILIGHDIDEALRHIATNLNDAVHVMSTKDFRVIYKSLKRGHNNWVDNDVNQTRRLVYDYLRTRKIICVDNIDCGLHHGDMLPYWNSVVSQVQKFDSQLFCTTHSDEMIEAAVQVCSECQELLKVYRIEKLGIDDVNVVEFDYSALVTAQMAGFEIR